MRLDTDGGSRRQNIEDIAWGNSRNYVCDYLKARIKRHRNCDIIKI